MKIKVWNRHASILLVVLMYVDRLRLFTHVWKTSASASVNVNDCDAVRSFKRDVTPPAGAAAPPQRPPANIWIHNPPVIRWRCYDAQRPCNAPCRVQSVSLMLLVTLYRFACSVESGASEGVLWWWYLTMEVDVYKVEECWHKAPPILYVNNENYVDNHSHLL